MVRPEQGVPSGSVSTGSWEGSFTQGYEAFVRPLDSISSCHWSLKPSSYLFHSSLCLLLGNCWCEVTSFQTKRVFCQWLLEVWKSGVESKSVDGCQASVRGEARLFPTSWPTVMLWNMPETERRCQASCTGGPLPCRERSFSCSTLTRSRWFTCKTSFVYSRDNLVDFSLARIFYTSDSISIFARGYNHSSFYMDHHLSRFSFEFFV